MLSACQFLEPGDCPADYPIGEGLTGDVLIRGGSCIVGPGGVFLAGPEDGLKTVLVVDLDLDEAVHGKFDLDVVGHYARPDIFTLQVDERPKTSVVVRSAGWRRMGSADDERRSPRRGTHSGTPDRRPARKRR